MFNEFFLILDRSRDLFSFILSIGKRNTDRRNSNFVSLQTHRVSIKSVGWYSWKIIKQNNDSPNVQWIYIIDRKKTSPVKWKSEKSFSKDSWIRFDSLDRLFDERGRILKDFSPNTQFAWIVISLLI